MQTHALHNTSAYWVQTKSIITRKIVIMIKRPKSSDTEEDLLQMQKEFLLEKYKNTEFQPAAKVVKLNKGNIM